MKQVSLLLTILLLCGSIPVIAQQGPLAQLMFDGDTHAATGSRIDGGAMAEVQYAAGLAGQALDLTAASPARFPIVLIDSTFSFEVGQSFSVQVWVRTEPDVQGTQAIFSNKDANDEAAPGWVLAVQSSGAWRWHASDGERQFDYLPTAPRQAINDGNWHHLAFTLDRTKQEARFYYDGLNVGIYHLQGLGGLTSGKPVVVGGSSIVEEAEWHSFNGYFDEALLWDRALMATEVTARYAQHRPMPDSRSAHRVDSLEVMAWNIWHGGHEHGETVGVERVVELIKASGADLIAMQETYGSGEEIADALGYFFYLRSSNLSVMSRYPIGETFDVYRTFNSGGARIHVGPDQAIDFFTIWLHYLPDYLKQVTQRTSTPDSLEANEGPTRHAEIRAILADIAPHLERTDTVPVIMAGDFNSGSHLDWTQEAASLHNGYVVSWPVSREMEAAGFTDTYRHVYPNPLRNQGRTWSPLSPHRPVKDRIDYIYVRGAGVEVLRASVIDTHRVKFPSDHAAVTATLKLPSAK